VTRPNLLFPITINLPKISELKKSSAEVKISNLIKYLAVYCGNPVSILNLKLNDLQKRIRPKLDPSFQCF
jgi:hypothetical protein